MSYVWRFVQHPSYPFVYSHNLQFSSGAVIPLELCHVPPGQLTRKHIPQDQTNAVLQFSTMHPNQRKQSVENGLGVSSVLCACRPVDDVPPGAAIRPVAIRSTIRHEHFKYPRVPRGPSHEYPHTTIQPSIQAAYHGMYCLPLFDGAK